MKEKHLHMYLKHRWIKIKNYIFLFVKWIIIASAAGVAGGIAGSAFSAALSYATGFREAHSFIIYFLPLSGLAIVWIYNISKMSGVGINTIIDSIQSSEKVPYLLEPVIFIATVITHLFGGSAGREGAALQLGGSIGYNVGTLFRLDENDHSIAVQCGMGAVFASLFGTPVTAAVFALEVISVGIIRCSAILPCLFSAIISAKIALMFHIAPESFPLTEVYALNLGNFTRTAVTAAVCALVSILFCLSMHTSDKLFKKYIPNPYLRIFAGGLIIVFLTLILRTRDYNGAGMNIVENALDGNSVPYAFLLKILFTTVTIGCGFKGGEIVPTFFIGATLGAVIGNIFGVDAGFYAAVGLIAMFCGVVNCPLASIILSVELFGSGSLALFALAVGISYTLSGYYGLYSSQKIVYSKLKSKQININTK